DLALEQERAAQPSLQGFLAAMRARDVTIKRDLAEDGSGVRVMTVHGAKGLEAPIVILADAASRPHPNNTRRAILYGECPDGPFFVCPGKKSDHTEQSRPLQQAVEDAEAAEYWRRLYVGMTRAEDELHVCGVLSETGKL